jgi:hypothetical protein
MLDSSTYRYWLLKVFLSKPKWSQKWSLKLAVPFAKCCSPGDPRRDIFRQSEKADGLPNRFFVGKFEVIVSERGKRYDVPSSNPISGEVGERLKPTVC